MICEGAGCPLDLLFVGSGGYFCALGVPRAHPKPYEKHSVFNVFCCFGFAKLCDATHLLIIAYHTKNTKNTMQINDLWGAGGPLDLFVFVPVAVFVRLGCPVPTQNPLKKTNGF